MTFKKDDHSKPRYDLIPPHAELELAHVLTHGAEKYGANNWHQGGPESKPRYIAAAQRHIAAYRRGETHDPESGRHHLAHAVASLMFAMELGRPSVEEMHGDAVKDEAALIWSMDRKGYRIEVFRKDNEFFANFIEHGRVVYVADDRTSAHAALIGVSNKVGTIPAQVFMEDAIAAYERESGVGE